MARGKRKQESAPISEPQETQEPLKQYVATDELDLSTATLAELATVAEQYSDRSYETLRRLSRGELLEIIKNQCDNREANANSSTLHKDADNLLKVFVELLDEIKKARENKPLNATLKRVYISQNNKLTEFLVNANVKSGAVSIGILLVLSFALLFDSFVGFDSFAKKLKERNEARRKEAEAKKQESSQPNSQQSGLNGIHTQNQ